MTDSIAAPRGFVHRPEPKAIGHAGRGEQIVGGALHLGGITLTGDFLAAEVPPTVAAELHGFGWLDDLAAVGTPRARARAFKASAVLLRKRGSSNRSSGG